MSPEKGGGDKEIKKACLTKITAELYQMMNKCYDNGMKIGKQLPKLSVIH